MLLVLVASKSNGQDGVARRLPKKDGVGGVIVVGVVLLLLLLVFML